jgi:hypothetical protein
VAGGSTSGPMTMAYNCSSSNRASLSRTRTSRASTCGCAKNISVNTSSFRSMMRGARSNEGVSNIIANVRIPAWATWSSRWLVSQGARTARPAQEHAARRSATRSGSGSKTQQFFQPLQKSVKDGPKNCDRKTLIASREEKSKPRQVLTYESHGDVTGRDDSLSLLFWLGQPVF